MSVAVDRRPSEANTGPKSGIPLTPMAGMTITKPGTVLSGVRISGSLRIQAGDVTIEDFELDAKGASYGVQMTDGKDGILLRRGKIVNASSSGLYGGGFHARRLEICEMGADAIKDTGGSLVEWCYVHRLGKIADAHADGMQMRRGAHSIYRWNNFDVPAPGEVGYPGAPYKANAAFIVQAAEGPISDVLLFANWLNGGGYCVYVTNKGAGMPSNVRLIENRWGRSHKYKLLEIDGPITWEGNIWDDTGAPISLAEAQVVKK